MTKLLLAAAAVIALTVPALADDPMSEWRTYFGAEVNYASPKFDNTYDPYFGNGTGAGVFAGYRFGKYYSIDAGYSETYSRRDGENSGTAFSAKQKIGGPTVDMYGYLPLWHSQISAFATVGASWMLGDFQYSVEDTSGGYITTKLSKRDFGYRFGGGVEFRPGNIFSWKITARYQSMDFGGVANNGIVIGTSISFSPF